MLTSENLAKLTEAVQHLDRAFTIVTDIYLTALNDKDAEWRNKPLDVATNFVGEIRHELVVQVSQMGVKSLSSFLAICSAAEVSVLTGLPEEATTKLIGGKADMKARNQALGFAVKVMEKLKLESPDLPEDKRLDNAERKAKKAIRDAEEKARVQAREEEVRKAREEGREPKVRGAKPRPPQDVIKMSEVLLPLPHEGEAAADYLNRYAAFQIEFMSKHPAYFSASGPSHATIAAIRRALKKLLKKTTDEAAATTTAATS